MEEKEKRRRLPPGSATRHPDAVDIEPGTAAAATTSGGGDPADDHLKQEQELQHIGTLDRKLKSRHVQFLALSGAIGTGLFVSSGQVLSLAGPLSAFVSYAVTGFNLYCVINSLGEMAAWLPIPARAPAPSLKSTAALSALGKSKANLITPIQASNVKSIVTGKAGISKI